MSEPEASERTVTVPVRSVLSTVMLGLIEAGRAYLREHPDDLAELEARHPDLPWRTIVRSDVPLQ